MQVNISLEQIKLYCADSKEILMAFLFGSYVSGYNCKESDVDIAVYLTKEDKAIEGRIQTYFERTFKKEVDLVVLNRCPATLAWTILRKGIPVVIKNRAKYIDFMLEVSNEAEDFLDFNLDTYRRKYAVRQTG